MLIHALRKQRSTRGSRRAGVALFVGCLSVTGAAHGQNVLDPPRLEALAPQPSREGPGSFIDGLSRKESTITVTLGHGRILPLKNDLFVGVNAKEAPSIAVGDPTVLDFRPISAKQIRLVGLRVGSTDLSISTADGRTSSFEVEVIPDLDLLLGQLRQTFPDAILKLGHIGDHLVVEGQARSATQVSQIVKTLEGSSAGGPGGSGTTPAQPPSPADPAAAPDPGTTSTGIGGPTKVLNLIRVPGSQQVLLKVRVAELNRTAMRQIGANALGINSKYGSIFGTQIGSPATGSAGSSATGPGLKGSVSNPLLPSTTLFGIFQNSNFDIYINALRDNSFLKVLAEPNVLALSGHQAQFLAGGQFPVPSPPQAGNGAVPAVTFKDFGVTLNFLPVVLDEGVIRLTVDPEFSSIDPSIATTIVPGGSPVPGINTRRAHTTVELRQGQTLAIAGLIQLTLEGRTKRIPGLGDLPILGPFFSNTTSGRVEKELIVIVTPYLVEPMEREQVPPGPGDEVNGPNDLEFYFLNRIEGRTGRDFRATTQGADPLRIGRLLRLERKHVHGPVGFSD